MSHKKPNVPLFKEQRLRLWGFYYKSMARLQEHHERFFPHPCDERFNDIILKEKTKRMDNHALNGNCSLVLTLLTLVD